MAVTQEVWVAGVILLYPKVVHDTSFVRPPSYVHTLEMCFAA